MALSHGQDQLQSYASLPTDCLTIMEPADTNRPSSALARGIRITEFKESKVNPEPVLQEESEYLLDEYLSPRRLRDLTGVEDLDDVSFLEMKVDTTDTSLGNFGSLLPNLSQLKLSNSVITAIRDLGSSLSNVQVLWMARCCMEDIDGISSMTSLKELYLAYNEIYDISPIGMLENLQILDLEGNNIEDISQVAFLAMCSKLTHLTLEGNPVCVMASPEDEGENYNYRSQVKQCVTQLQYLDDEKLEAVEDEMSASASVFEDDWKLIDELLQEGTLPETEETLDLPGRPTTALRPTTGYRPMSALKPQTAGRRGSTRSGGRPGTGFRPGTSSRAGMIRPGSGRPGSGSRPTTAGRPRSGSKDVEESTLDDSSDLTTGAVVCGNPSKALKARSRQLSKLSKPANTALQELRQKTEHSYDTEQEEGSEVMVHLKGEIEEWKREHQMRLEKINAAKAPQVLTINHDDAVSLSGDEDSVSSDLENDLPMTFNSRVSVTAEERISSYPEEQLYKDDRVPQAPHPPANGGARPKVSSPPTKPYSPDYRHRRLRRHDESFDANEQVGSPGSESFREPRSPGAWRTPVPPTSPDTDDRPYSGSEVRSKGRYRTEPMNKKEPKVIDRKQPVIRTSVQSPEQRTPPGPGVAATKAALPQQPVLRTRRQLPQVPILPSKLAVPK